MEEAEKLSKAGEMYVGAIVTPSKTLYASEWGCPEGGEDTIVFFGLLNPKFLSDEDRDMFRTMLSGEQAPPKLSGYDKWEKAVIAVATAVAKRLDQNNCVSKF